MHAHTKNESHTQTKTMATKSTNIPLQKPSQLTQPQELSYPRAISRLLVLTPPFVLGQDCKKTSKQNVKSSPLKM